MLLNDSEMTLPSELNTHVKRTNLPIQTSPNWPAPSFFTNLIDSRGISHASLSHGFWGLGLIQAFSNFLHKPSDCPGFQRKNKIQIHYTPVPYDLRQTLLNCTNQPTIIAKKNRCYDENVTFLVLSQKLKCLLSEISHSETNLIKKYHMHLVTVGLLRGFSTICTK